MRYLILIAATTFLITIYFIFLVARNPASANDQSRLAGIVSIVRYNELNIDKTPQHATADRIFSKGKFYSSKPPLLNVTTGLVIKVAISMINVLLLENDSAIYRIATYLNVIFPITLIFLVFNWILIKLIKIKPVLALIYSLYLIFGTLIFTYSRHLNNHVMETLTQLLLLCILLKAKLKTSDYIFAGLLLSILFIVDETYGIIAIPITVFFIFYLTWYKTYELKNIKMCILLILIGLLPLLMVHFYIHYLQFSTIIPPQLLKDSYLDYPGSRWFNPTGARENLNENLLTRVFNYTFGTYGFFLYQPLLIVPFFNLANYKSRLFFYSVFLLIAYVLFNATLQTNYGGSAYGPRRFLPLIPLFFLCSITSFRRLNKSFIILLFVLTAIISLIGYTNPWENWNYYNDSSGKFLYFPLLYTISRFAFL